MTTFNEDVVVNGSLEVVPSDYSKPWLQLGQGGDAGRLRVEYPQVDSGYSLAPNLVMSDLDDPPRIRFQQIGSQTEADPEFESWIGHAKSKSNDLAIMGGYIGIGTTNPLATLHVQGDIITTGDIALKNADCAEEFVVENANKSEPGAVMVLTETGMLQESTEAYDKKVAGIVSGAGDLKPGIVLDKQSESANRIPIALMGKVYCKVDAQYGSIEVGDLLTTSPTPGHAMKATEPTKAFGAIIGKALRALDAGTGLIPVLVSLQ